MKKSTCTHRINFIEKKAIFNFSQASATPTKSRIALVAMLVGVVSVYSAQKYSQLTETVAAVNLSAKTVEIPETQKVSIEKEVSATANFAREFEAKKVNGVLALTEEKASSEIRVTLDSDTFFESGSAKLLGRADESLEQIESVMKTMSPNAVVEIEGHTDDSPVIRQKKYFPSNWELSAARAASLIPMFERAGIKKDKLRVVGYGDSRPVVPNREPTSARNRRIVFRIFPLGDSTKRL